ncbi:hypothetical protein [Roseobacter sp. S98]|uniref:hypothetical protein n=1 Tax=Roseobacter algicola (ex Choi et al. 2025) (nom. illeg.) TaxID=3092138 RepID=UPI0035C6D55E
MDRISAALIHELERSGELKKMTEFGFPIFDDPVAENPIKGALTANKDFGVLSVGVRVDQDGRSVNFERPKR